MILRSIPPANQQRPQCISSMRSATRAGLIFVGGRVGNCQPIASKNQFQPKAIRPDPKVQEYKKAFFKANQLLIEQLDGLIQVATDPGEVSFWQREIKRLKGNT